MAAARKIVKMCAGKGYFVNKKKFLKFIIRYRVCWREKLGTI